MKTILLNEIPRESSRVEEVVLDQAELDELFQEVEDFKLVDPDRVEGKLKLQRIGEHVRLAGWVMVPVSFECGRCLGQQLLELEAELEYMLIPRSEWVVKYDTSDEEDGGDDDESGFALSAQDLGVAPYDSDEIDPKPFIRESLLIELPTYAVCPESLKASCDKVYEANVGAKALEKNEEASMDPRWAELLKLKKLKEED